jgi:hypothetical protein
MVRLLLPLYRAATVGGAEARKLLMGVEGFDGPRSEGEGEVEDGG